MKNKRINIRKLIGNLVLAVFVFSAGIAFSQVTVEKTIPEEIKTSEIAHFVIHTLADTGRYIDVYLVDGRNYTTTKAQFLNFWNNTMTQTQRNTVRGFIKQLTAVAADVDNSKVTGNFIDE